MIKAPDTSSSRPSSTHIFSGNRTRSRSATKATEDGSVYSPFYFDFRSQDAEGLESDKFMSRIFKQMPVALVDDVDFVCKSYAPKGTKRVVYDPSSKCKRKMDVTGMLQGCVARVNLLLPYKVPTEKLLFSIKRRERFFVTEWLIELVMTDDFFSIFETGGDASAEIASWVDDKEVNKNLLTGDASLIKKKGGTIVNLPVPIVTKIAENPFAKTLGLK